MYRKAYQSLLEQMPVLQGEKLYQGKFVVEAKKVFPFLKY